MIPTHDDQGIVKTIFVDPVIRLDDSDHGIFNRVIQVGITSCVKTPQSTKYKIVRVSKSVSTIMTMVSMASVKGQLAGSFVVETLMCSSASTPLILWSVMHSCSSSGIWEAA